MIQAHPWADGDSQGFFEVSFEETFRQAVAAYRRHRRLSARRFADAALGKGGLQFIRPYRGRSIRLATADKVLRFMGEPRFGPLFRREVEGFLAVTGMKAYLLGEMAVGDSGAAVSLASCGESVAEDDPGLLTTRQTAAQVGLSSRSRGKAAHPGRR